MLTDPQSITISGSAVSLPRTSSGVNAGVFTAGDGSDTLSVSHTYGKRTRRVVRLDNKKIAADPFTSGQNDAFSASVYLVVDHPSVGYTVTELAALVNGFTAYLAASSGAVVTKVLGGEN